MIMYVTAPIGGDVLQLYRQRFGRRRLMPGIVLAPAWIEGAIS